MGTPSLFALIFLLMAAIQLSSPQAFGQSGGQNGQSAQNGPAAPPTAQGDNRADPGNALPLTGQNPDPSAAGAQSAQPADSSKLCTQLDFLQASEKDNFNKWHDEYARKTNVLKAAQLKQAELIPKLVARMKKQTDLLKQELDGRDVSKADPATGRMAGAQVPIWDSVKDGIKAVLQPEIKTYADSQGWKERNEKYTGDGLDYGVDAYVYDVTSGDPKNPTKDTMVTTVNLSDTKNGPELIVSTYFRDNSKYEEPGKLMVDPATGMPMKGIRPMVTTDPLTPRGVTTYNRLFTGVQADAIRTQDGIDIPDTKTMPTETDYLRVFKKAPELCFGGQAPKTVARNRGQVTGRGGIVQASVTNKHLSNTEWANIDDPLRTPVIGRGARSTRDQDHH
jgi:hypothetical protein